MAHAMSVETPNSTIAGNLAAATIGRVEVRRFWRGRRLLETDGPAQKALES